LSLLPLTRYPFEAHYARTENRSSSSSDLAAAQSYAGQSYGFSQAYNGGGFNLNGGWDRGTQNQGRDRQDTLQLSGSHNQELQQINVLASLSRNVHVDADVDAEPHNKQLTQQANVSLTHAIAPNEALNVDSIVSVNQSDYRLAQGSGSTRVNQLSSNAFWRPEEYDLTLNGGVRLLSMQTDATSANVAAQPFGAPSRSASTTSNANFNLGASYEFSQFLRLQGTANLSLAEVNGVRNAVNSQSGGLSYAPESIAQGS